MIQLCYGGYVWWCRIRERKIGDRGGKSSNKQKVTRWKTEKFPQNCDGKLIFKKKTKEKPGNFFVYSIFFSSFFFSKLSFKNPYKWKIGKISTSFSSFFISINFPFNGGWRKKYTIEKLRFSWDFLQSVFPFSSYFSKKKCIKNGKPSLGIDLKMMKNDQILRHYGSYIYECIQIFFKFIFKLALFYHPLLLPSWFFFYFHFLHLNCFS